MAVKNKYKATFRKTVQIMVALDSCEKACDSKQEEKVALLRKAVSY
jgi:hypothetical protein